MGGSFVHFSPGSQAEGVTFRVNVPSSTASSKSGPIYFQIEAPEDIQWVGLGQGTDMDGANVFMLYSASTTNVTLSPRLATGTFQPDVNPNAKVSLLDGTGISKGKMIANVRCDSCMSWDGGSLDPKDTASAWIWAMKRGSPIRSTNIDKDLKRHDDKGGFYLDLTKAIGGNSDNPFRNMPSSTATVPSSPGSTSPPGSIPKPKKKNTSQTRRSAHGLIMSIVVVVLFPLFALSLYVVPSSKTVPFIHAPLQLVTLCLAVAGFGIGISLAKDLKVLTGYHPIIGMVMVGCLVLFQPALGLLQHMHYRKTGTRSSFGVLHRWGGRLLIALGVVNGGLGFKFSGIGNPGVPKAGAIAYGVVAGIMGLVYVGIVLLKSFKSKHSAKAVSVTGGTPPKSPIEAAR